VAVLLLDEELAPNPVIYPVQKIFDELFKGIISTTLAVII